jgi:hypothetical protein
MMESNQAECPVCFGQMELEDQAGELWLICPNGCPTEFEAPAEIQAPELEAAQVEVEELQVRARAAAF